VAGEERSADLARVWAEALFRVAEEKGVAETVLDQIEQIAGWGATHPEFGRALLSPLASPEERAQGLERIFRGRAHDVLVDFLQVLNRKGRSALLGAVARQYRAVLQAARGVVDVTVASAVALDDAGRERVRSAVRKRTGLEPRLVEKVDPSLLGGLVVRVGDAKYDTSLSTKLERMRHALLERATSEIIQGRTRTPEEMR
jgi:F-type H+-transporting ATPase subunit delta